mmetsp:Transcript_543/g.900  ORF Transcript_543/g.900 Transcript_543/m.900 type:complete len:115 (+) Transcript_543:394-738(+)
MGNNCLGYCSMLSFVGAVYLTGLGLALQKEYEYLPISDKKDRASNCYWTAIVYLVIFVVSLCFFMKKTKNQNGYQKIASDNQAQERNGSSEERKEPNQAFDSAGLGSSLLVSKD